MYVAGVRLEQSLDAAFTFCQVGIYKLKSYLDELESIFGDVLCVTNKVGSCPPRANNSSPSYLSVTRRIAPVLVLCSKFLSDRYWEK